MQQNCRILFVANGKHDAERCILTQSKKNCNKNILEDNAPDPLLAQITVTGDMPPFGTGVLAKRLV